MKRILLALAILCSSVSWGRIYQTNFPGTENPICEGGNWANGATTPSSGACNGIQGGLDWHDMATNGSYAYNVGGTGYTDGTAVVTGSWGATQYAKGTARCNAADSNPEVELRLRTTIAAHSITGYEFDLGCASSDNPFIAIVRWNGPEGSFTQLYPNDSSHSVTTGDVVVAEAVGCNLSLSLNGTVVATATDCTYATGNPGIGAEQGSGTDTDQGWSTFYADDGNDTMCGNTGSILGNDGAGDAGLLQSYLGCTTGSWPTGYSVTSMAVNLSAAGGNLQVAVYADSSGAPGALLCSSLAVAASSGLNTVTLLGCGTLQRFSNFWLGVELSSGTPGVDYTGTGTNGEKYVSSTFGIFPNPFGSPTNANFNGALYLNLTTGAAAPIVWSTYDGVTVGTVSGNVSQLNGVSIGQVSGDYGAWNNLTSPPGTPAVVETVGATTNGTTSAITDSFVSNTTVGELIVVTVWNNGTSSCAPSTVTDSASQTYVKVWGIGITPDGAACFELWYVANSTSGVSSVSVTLGNSSHYGAAIAGHYKNVLTSGPLDSIATVSPVSAPTTTPWATPTISTSGNTELLLAPLYIKVKTYNSGIQNSLLYTGSWTPDYIICSQSSTSPCSIQGGNIDNNNGAILGLAHQVTSSASLSNAGTNNGSTNVYDNWPAIVGFK